MKLILQSIVAFIGIMILFLILEDVFISHYYIKAPLVQSILIFTMVIFVGYLLFIAIKKSTQYFSQEESLSHFIYRMKPFRSIESLIKESYLNENILRKKWCFDGFINFLSSGRIPVGFNYQINFPFPATIIETNEAYYIDRRLQNILNLLVIIILFYSFFGYLYYINPSDRRSLGSFLQFSSIIVIFISVPLIILALFWQTVDIVMIRKDWLNSTSNKGRFLTLTGVRPKNSQTSLSKNKFLNMGSVSNSFKQTFFLL